MSGSSSPSILLALSILFRQEDQLSTIFLACRQENRGTTGKEGKNGTLFQRHLSFESLFSSPWYHGPLNKIFLSSYIVYLNAFGSNSREPEEMLDILEEDESGVCVFRFDCR